MPSFAKNERGFRIAAGAIVFLPLACLIIGSCKSELVILGVLALYSLLAVAGLLGFLYEKAEEEEESKR